jgi:hypothetical protein
MNKINLNNKCDKDTETAALISAPNFQWICLRDLGFV